MGARNEEKAMGEKKPIHIGEEIRAEVKRQGRTVEWVARRMPCDKSNIYKLFKKESIDVKLLMRFGEVLGRDFFKMYSERLSGQIGEL